MEDNSWIAGPEVLKLLNAVPDKATAKLALRTAIGLGEVQVRFASRRVARSIGGPQLLAGGSFTSKLWRRAESSYSGDDLWGAGVLSLPASGKDQAVELITISFDHQEVMSVLAPYGQAEKRSQAADNIKRPRPGGHHMGAHGEIISATTIKLLGWPLLEVKRLTEKKLAEDLHADYKAFGKAREDISEVNRVRMARRIIVNVVTELERRDAGTSTSSEGAE